MKKPFLIAATLLGVVPAFAQSGAPVKQSGNVTPNQVPWWVTSGVIGGGVSSADSPVTSFGVTNSGGNGICANSDRITAVGRNTICIGSTTNGPSFINVQNYGTATPQPLVLNLNGASYQFPFSTSGVVGPNPTVIGNIAYWNNTVGTLLGATPAYQAGNPANAALYSVVASPPAVAVPYNVLQVSQGQPITANLQFGAGNVGLQQAVVGTSTIPLGDTTTLQAVGVAGYALTNVAAGGAGGTAVGAFGQASANVAGTSLFGSNFVAQNEIGNASVQGFDVNYITGAELNANLWKKPGGADPVVTQAFGLTIAGSSNLAAAPAVSAGIVVNALSVATLVPWNAGFMTYGGAALSVITAGPTAFTGNNLNSQSIDLQSTSATGTVITARMFSTGPRGDIFVSPSSTTGGTLIVNSHINTFGTAPTLTSCGSGTVSGGSTDTAGQVTATGATSCTVLFHATYDPASVGTAPFCTVTDNTTAAALKAVITATQIVVSGLTSGDAFTYICVG